MKTIAEIREEFEKSDISSYGYLMEIYAEDARAGVQNLLSRYAKKKKAYEDELLRTERLKTYERKYEHLGWICGIDEVGRGPLAGPVVACAVILPKDCDILYLNDSKKLTAAKREELFSVIMEKAVSVGIGMRSHERIDEINILQATYEAMRDAVSQLSVTPQVLLNDAVIGSSVLCGQRTLFLAEVDIADAVSLFKILNIFHIVPFHITAKTAPSAQPALALSHNRSRPAAAATPAVAPVCQFL